jgi:7,8-dihydroneopterin aldolase/epimerase/oxygenase
MNSTLQINKLVLPINIGVTTEERATPQDIEFNITIHFTSLPKACSSDHINDTICYASLVETIKSLCSNKEFHLIEHLCSSVYEQIKLSLSPTDILDLQVCKTPPLAEVHDNCCFSIKG